MSKKSKKRQIANALNAQKSTGPVTDEGKAISSQNATTHGLFSTQVVLDSESEELYRAFYLAMMAELKPVGPHETHFAERYIQDMWRTRRGIAYHTSIENEIKDIRERVRLFDQYSRAMGRIDSRMFRAREELRSLQAARQKQERRQAPPCQDDEAGTPVTITLPPDLQEALGSFDTPARKKRNKQRNLQQYLHSLGTKPPSES